MHESAAGWLNALRAALPEGLPHDLEVDLTLTSGLSSASWRFADPSLRLVGDLVTHLSCVGKRLQIRVYPALIGPHGCFEVTVLQARGRDLESISLAGYLGFFCDEREATLHALHGRFYFHDTPEGPTVGFTSMLAPIGEPMPMQSIEKINEIASPSYSPVRV